MKVNIEPIINQRLNLPTNKRIFEDEFEIPAPDIKKIKYTIKNRYLAWDDDKKSRFIRVVGGPVNYRRTEKYINDLLKS